MIYNLNLCVARDQTANHVDMIYVCGLCSKAYQSERRWRGMQSYMTSVSG